MAVYTTLSLFLVVSLLACQGAFAGDLDKLILFNIKAESLDKALLQFGAQAHVQISIAMNSAIRGLKAPRLTGNYTGRQALARLLKNTNLTFDVKGSIVEVSAASSRQPPSRDPASTSHVTKQFDIAKQAQTESANQRKLHEIVITGSRLLATSKEGAEEVQTYNRVQIDQSGQNSVQDFLNTLPSFSTISASTALGVSPTVTLRGFPTGTTLVLLNGRRLENSGTASIGNGAYFDLNNIPLAAVERIEVDQNGSSAIYGSDAIAGTVNIVLKNDFSGFAADTRYDAANSTNSSQTDLAWGSQWDRGGIEVIGTYGLDGGLLNSERRLTSSNNYISFGAKDNNYPECLPGNVFSTSGAPLPGAPAGSEATYAAVTGQSASGRPALSQFTYGALNTCAITSPASLMPVTHRGGVYVQGHMTIAPDTQVFAELIYTHVSQVEWEGDQYLFGIQGYQEYTVSASNPYNPFGSTVGVSTLLAQIPVVILYNTDFFRPLVGIKGILAGRFQWELSAWESVDWTQNITANYLSNYTGIQTALNSSDPSTALNPFVTGPVASLAELRPFFTDENLKVMGRDRSMEAFIRGPALQLPAGAAQVVAGGDYTRSALDTDYVMSNYLPANARQNYGRTSYAIFGETRIPLLRGGGLTPSNSLLSVTVAGRHDQYSDFGSATTDQFGLELRPTQALLLRATYAEAFQAPSLPDLYNPQSTLPSLVTNPLTGGETLAQITSGGNPDLRALTGRSHSAGIVYASRLVSGLALSVTQWTVVENNAIQAVPQQVIVDNDSAFPGRVAFNANGQIVSVNDTAVNFGSIDAAGVDYELKYLYRVGAGTISISTDASQTYHYLEALVPGGEAIEAAGVAQDDHDWAPRWKGAVAVGWKQGTLRAYIDGRYTGRYQDYDSARFIGNIWLLDGNVRWDIGQRLGLMERWLKSSYIEAGATNLFNRAPQFSNYGADFTGYDAAEMSIVGRSGYVQLGIEW